MSIGRSLPFLYLDYNSPSSSDYQDYLVYKRPPGFQFNFPADKTFVWVQEDPKAKKYVVAEVLDDSDDSVTAVRLVDNAEVPFLPHVSRLS